jgi:hypothetical protein
MCAEDNRAWAWLRRLTRARPEGEWPRLVWQDFIGLCALGALLAALIALAGGG